ncbi:hypothetical protein Mapa_011716 [Marchantia paleacea]|nr:hypothetical protein Mapa_011716 [Marchantia paleacea]
MGCVKRRTYFLYLSILVTASFLEAIRAETCTCDAAEMGDTAPGCVASSENTTYDSDPAVDRFRRYLRIRTDQPSPNYCCAVAYIRTVVDSIGGLETREVSYGASVYKPFLIVTWKGLEPSLPSILLNSHTDVVQADPATWTYDPFCAFMDKNGNIFGRGSQDTKDLGSDGFQAFSKSSDFTDLNVGIALDEGGTSPGDNFTLYNREKAAWWLTIESHGQSGHGAFVIKNTALENLFKSLPLIMEYRQTLVDKLEAGADDGGVTSINPTYLSAGITTDTFMEFNEVQAPTVANASSPWWTLLSKAVTDSGFNISPPSTVPATTDSRFIGAHNIAAFNFAPVSNTISRLHGDDEYLNAAVYLAGIPVYEKILKEFASYQELATNNFSM